MEAATSASKGEIMTTQFDEADDRVVQASAEIAAVSEYGKQVLPPAKMFPAGPLTPGEVKERIDLVLAVMRAVMKESVHYGKIPGTPKNSLWKPGSEILQATFQFGTRPIDRTDLSTDDKVHYIVTSAAFAHYDGRVLGEAMGECSSDEEKYRWRKAFNKQEWDETPEDRRRLKWRRNYKSSQEYQEIQVRTAPADVANTILKMAEKRSDIAVVLKVVPGASAIFTQDVIEEDDTEPPETTVSGDGQSTAPMPGPKRRSEVAQGRATAPTATAAEPVRSQPSPAGTRPPNVFSVFDCRFVKEGENARGPWKMWSVKLGNGKEAVTFDAHSAELCENAKGTGVLLAMTFKKSDKGIEITGAEKWPSK
jgi:hypothetical protein